MAYKTRARRATAFAATAAAVVGAVAVTVVQPGAAFSAGAPSTVLAAGFTVPVPVVTSLTPASGSIEGGTGVTILGSNFKNLDVAYAVSVTFGGVPATRLVVVSDTKLVAFAPAGDVGTVLVKVTNAAGVSANVASKFSYRMSLGAEFASVPVRATGGEQVDVGVTGGTVGATSAAFPALKITAKVGGVAAVVKYVDPSHLKITVPPSAKTGSATIQLFHDGFAGPVSTATLAYYPVVTSVTAATVSADGGAEVKITGAGFLGVDAEVPSSVTFAGNDAVYFDVVSAVQIVAAVPPGVGGFAAVQVTTASGANPASPAARVRYRAPLGIDTSGLAVKAGGGSHLLTVTGGTLGVDAKEFAAQAVSVTLGASKLRPTYVDPTHLAVTLPATKVESVQLRLLHDTIPGPEATVEVVPVIVSMSASADTIAGGKKVTIKVVGLGAAEATDFTFGAGAATCETGSSMTFVCTVPPTSQAGPVWVSFTSGAGTRSRFTGASAFSYTDLD